jgi:hypothetical protein
VQCARPAAQLKEEERSRPHPRHYQTRQILSVRCPPRLRAEVSQPQARRRAHWQPSLLPLVLWLWRAGAGFSRYGTLMQLPNQWTSWLVRENSGACERLGADAAAS